MFFLRQGAQQLQRVFILTVSFWGLWIKRNTMWCTSSWLFLAGIGPCSFIGLFVALLALDSPTPLSWSAATKSRFMVMVSLLFCLAVLVKIHEAPDLFGVYVGWQVMSRILPELYWFELLFLSASSEQFFQNVSKAWGKDITFKYIYAYIHDTHVFFQWTCPHLQAWPWRLVAHWGWSNGESRRSFPIWVQDGGREEWWKNVVNGVWV